MANPGPFGRYYAACFALAARLTRPQGYAVWIVPFLVFWGLFEYVQTGWAFVLFWVVFLVAAPFMAAHHKYWQDHKNH